MTIPLSTTLGDAKTWLRARVKDGARCPCCNQMAKVYKRKVTSGHVRALATMWGEAKAEWFYLPDVQKKWQSRDESTMRFFGLIEEAKQVRPDGGRAGWWRITPHGKSFLFGQASVPKYARIYDGRCLGFEGEMVTVHDAIGTKFSYADLMSGL